MTYRPPVDKAGPLRYTDHYVFNNADCLGKGATASVFLARHRDNGDLVAIKVFNEGSRQVAIAKERELGVLGTIRHHNVMKFISCEKEQSTGHEVLIMEYCQGGSVFTLLDQPQNAFGFQESDFMRFLKDISNGLKFLWSKGIVHRDIKPGNIMKRIGTDGSVSFVLTDFGAARELQEDESFMSIHGTEEYIHPNMYQRAVLRQPGQNHFNSSVDLWSLGVTLYHVITGSLPFRPHGGRKDTFTMFQITSGRESGVISGVQNQPNGPIEWSRKLPKTCNLPRSLQLMLEPILAGLFDSDPRKALSFDKYFDLVNQIVNMSRVSVFNCHECVNYAVYVNKTESQVHLQERIAALTGIPAAQQLLLVAHKPLRDVVPYEDQIQTYPKSVLKSSIFLYDLRLDEILSIIYPELPKFPSLPLAVSIPNDAAISKKIAGIVYYIETQTSAILQNQKCLQEALACLQLYIKEVLHPIESCVPDLEKTLVITDKRLNSLKLSQSNVNCIFELLKCFDLSSELAKSDSNNWSVFCDPHNGLNEIIGKAFTRIEEIKVYLSVLVQKLKEQEFGQTTDGYSCQESDICLMKVQHLRQSIQGVVATFVKHKKYGELHPHEVFIHKVERQKLEDLCIKILSLYQDHCVQNLTRLHTSVNKRISILLKHLTRTGKVETNIKSVTECQAQINEKIDKIDDAFKTASHTASANVQKLLSQSNFVLTSQIKIRDDTTCASGKVVNESTVGKSGQFESKDKRSIKSELMESLSSEIESLQLETSELDGLMKTNVDSLIELRSLLNNTGTLTLGSFTNEKRQEVH